MSCTAQMVSAHGRVTPLSDMHRPRSAYVGGVHGEQTECTKISAAQGAPHCASEKIKLL